VLLDIEAMVGVMKGVVMELTDCALPLLKGLFSKMDTDAYIVLPFVDCLVFLIWLITRSCGVFLSVLAFA